MSLPELLAELSRCRDNGVVALQDATGERRLLVVDGAPWAASSTHPDEQPAAWLERLGAGAGDPTACQRQLNALAAHILVRAGGEEPLLLDPPEPLDPTEWECTFDAATPELLLQVARAFPDDQRKRQALEPMERHARAQRSLTDVLEELRLTPVEAFLLSRLDGRRRLDELAVSCGSQSVEAVRALYALAVAGLISLGEEEEGEEGRSRCAGTAVDLGTLSGAEREEREELAARAAALVELDHYAALEIQPTATAEEVERAWRSVAARYHPDRAVERHLLDKRKQLEEVYARLEAAFQVLSSPTTRERYDRVRAEVLAACSGEPAAPTAEDAERAASARRELVEANLRRADTLVMQGETHLAARLLAAAAELDPQPGTLVRLARVYRTRPVWRGRALSALQRAVTLEPRHVPAWLELADFWRERKDRERERKALVKALTADPGDAPARAAFTRAFGERELERALRRLAR